MLNRGLGFKKCRNIANIGPYMVKIIPYKCLID